MGNRMLVFACLILVSLVGVAVAQQEQALNGTWAFQDQYEELQLRFTPDGRYVLNGREMGQGAYQVLGAYRYDGRVLTASPDNQPVERYPLSMAGTDRFHLNLGSDGIYEFRRTGGPVGGPSPQTSGNQPAPAPRTNSPAPRQQAAPAPQTARPVPTGVVPDPLVLVPYRDRTENAFTILVPQGWSTAGGIERVNPNQAGGTAQSIEAKFNFSMMRDRSASVMLRWLPHTYFITLQGSPAQSMFSQGSNYSGMMVLPLMSPNDFAVRMVVPTLNPHAQNVRVVEQQNLPRLADLHRNQLADSMGVRYSAGVTVVEFTENGILFREKILVVIEDRGPATLGQWDNRLTIVGKAPAADYVAWEPVFGEILNSAQVEPNWVRGELQGQIQRGEIALQQQAEVQRIEREIVENRQRTNAEIAGNQFLNLMGQENYVNPHTGAVETGTNRYDRRWQNDQGQIIYSNSPGYDPNVDPNMQAGGFKLSRVKGGG